MYLTEKYKKPISLSQAKPYEESLKHYRDLKNSLDTAHDEGYEEGVEAGILEEKRNTIKLLNKLDYGYQEIAKHTSTDISFVKDVLAKLK